MQDVVQDLPYLYDLEFLFRLIHSFFSRSGVRVAELQKIAENIKEPFLKIPQFISIRWASLENAVSKIWASYKVRLLFLPAKYIFQRISKAKSEQVSNTFLLSDSIPTQFINSLKNVEQTGKYNDRVITYSKKQELDSTNFIKNFSHKLVNFLKTRYPNIEIITLSKFR